MPFYGFYFGEVYMTDFEFIFDLFKFADFKFTFVLYEYKKKTYNKVIGLFFDR